MKKIIFIGAVALNMFLGQVSFAEGYKSRPSVIMEMNSDQLQLEVAKNEAISATYNLLLNCEIIEEVEDEFLAKLIESKNPISKEYDEVTKNKVTLKYFVEVVKHEKEARSKIHCVFNSINGMLLHVTCIYPNQEFAKENWDVLLETIASITAE